jgi:hypothetical protein
VNVTLELGGGGAELEAEGAVEGPFLHLGDRTCTHVLEGVL